MQQFCLRFFDRFFFSTTRVTIFLGYIFRLYKLPASVAFFFPFPFFFFIFHSQLNIIIIIISMRTSATILSAFLRRGFSFRRSEVFLGYIFRLCKLPTPVAFFFSFPFFFFIFHLQLNNNWNIIIIIISIRTSAITLSTFLRRGFSFQRLE